MTIASIIVPAFNVETTLAQTMNMLLSQTYDDFEVIIVDDGSVDNTATIAATFCTDKRVRIITQANRGLAGARNTGIAAAHGDFIGLCDADDLWEAEKLATHINHLQANPHVGLSFSGSAFINDDGAFTGQTQRPRLTGIDAAHIFKRNPIGNGSAVVIRRTALDQISYRPPSEADRNWYFDETFRQSEDIECWLRIGLTTNWSFEGVSGLLTRYRINSGGLSAATDKQHAAWERMVEKLTPCAPDFFASHATEARAYQLRYLSRRAIVDLDGQRAMQLSRQWLAESKAPLWNEPKKSCVTLFAALALRILGQAPLQQMVHLATQLQQKRQTS